MDGLVNWEYIDGPNVNFHAGYQPVDFDISDYVDYYNGKKEREWYNSVLDRRESMANRLADVYQSSALLSSPLGGPSREENSLFGDIVNKYEGPAVRSYGDTFGKSNVKLNGNPVDRSMIGSYKGGDRGLSLYPNFLINWEGNKVHKDPGDGSIRKLGITIGPHGVRNMEELKALTPQIAANRLVRDYYIPVGGYKFHPAIGWFLGDSAYQSGVGGARRIMNNAWGTTDPNIVNGWDVLDTLDKLVEARKNYSGIKKYSNLQVGLNRRINAARDIAYSLIGG